MRVIVYHYRMSGGRFRLVALALFVGILLVISVGMGPTSTSGEPDPDELVERAVTSIEEEPIEALRTTEIDRPDGTIQQTVAIQEKPPDHVRMELKESITASTEQELRVTDGSTAWEYRPDRGEVIHYDDEQYWFEEFQTVGASPKEILENYESEYKGTTRHDDREVHVLELEPSSDATVSLSLDLQAGGTEYEIGLHQAGDRQWYVSRETWLIDVETSYPIKQHVKWIDEDETVVATVTQEYEELTVGADIDEDVFQFDPSTGSPGTDTDVVETAVFETPYAATSAVPFDVPVPNVPDAYEHKSATVNPHGEENAVLLWYESEWGSVSVHVSQTESPSPGTHERNIYEQRIGSFNGWLTFTDDSATVVRECDGLVYRVSGSPNADKLIDIADSMECQ